MGKATLQGLYDFNSELRFLLSPWAQMAEKLLLIFSGLFSHMPLTKVKTETEWFIEELKNLIPSCITPVCISKVIAGGLRCKSDSVILPGSCVSVTCALSSAVLTAYSWLCAGWGDHPWG